MSESKVTYKMKVAQLQEQTKKTVFEPFPDPKTAHQGPKKSKKYPKIKSKSKVRIEGTIENKSCSTTNYMNRPQKSF